MFELKYRRPAFIQVQNLNGYQHPDKVADEVKKMSVEQVLEIRASQLEKHDQNKKSIREILNDASKQCEGYVLQLKKQENSMRNRKNVFVWGIAAVLVSGSRFVWKVVDHLK